MHNQRVKTALLALPVLILLISAGGPFLFYVLICAVSVLSLREHDNIVSSMGPPAGDSSLVASLPVYLSSPVFLYGVYKGNIAWVLLSLLIAFFPLAFRLLYRYNAATEQSPEDHVLVGSVFGKVHGLIYIQVLLSFLIMIRGGDSSGVHWIYLLLLVVAGSDTGAYYTGTHFGKHKLCPNVSPKKTIEGFAGGVLTAVAVGSFYKWVFIPELPWKAGILMMILAACLGAAGDLYESVLKRAGGIKDSGTILPGHGGMLDRIDALMFAAPVVFLFREVVL